MKSNIFLVFLFSLIMFGNYGVTLAQEKVDVSMEKVTSFTYACLPHKGDYRDHEMVIGKFLEAVTKQNISPMGPMIGIYYNSPRTTKPENLIWEIGFPVTDSIKVSKPLVIKKWEYTPVAKAMHIGPYEKSGEIYPQIFKWIGENKLIPAGPVMERFLDDPKKVKPEELKTEIWIPILEKEKTP